MNTDGMVLTRPINNPAHDPRADWSPGGERIALGSDHDGNWEMYVMKADGTWVSRFADISGNALSQAWPPGRERIAFGSDPDGNVEIYVLNADGTWVSRRAGNPTC